MIQSVFHYDTVCLIARGVIRALTDSISVTYSEVYSQIESHYDAVRVISF